MDDLEELEEMLENQWRELRQLYRENDDKYWIMIRELVEADDGRGLIGLISQGGNLQKLIQGLILVAMDKVALDCQ